MTRFVIDTNTVASALLFNASESVEVCRDPKDDHILELAINGNALFIVTGDYDLLALDPFRGVRIVTPVEFLRSGG